MVLSDPVYAINFLIKQFTDNTKTNLTSCVINISYK